MALKMKYFVKTFTVSNVKLPLNKRQRYIFGSPMQKVILKISLECKHVMRNEMTDTLVQYQCNNVAH